MFEKIICSISNARTWVSLCVLVLSACAGNVPFRDADTADCTQSACEGAFIERHDGYDLAFVEFTERGNVFDRAKLQAVVEHVESFAEGSEDNPQAGVLAVVYVHGWKHNAAPGNNNVQSFQNLLEKTAILTEGSPRRLVGIYVGWRGVSLSVPVIKNLSYWDRKDVAHQVGKGGVTELLLRLENVVVDDEQPNRNLFMVTAHSFGSVIVLSALNEILLERIIDAGPESEMPLENPEEDCVVSRPFGHGVALINPAIEANEILQLKEAVAERSFCSTQDRLMHIISSDADQATNVAFRVGQWFGVNLGWRQTVLEREIDGESRRFEESALDTITVGNYPPFRTGRLEQPRNGQQLDQEEQVWSYKSCVDGRKDCLFEDERDNHVPVDLHEPLAFIHTDSAFIPDHNDVFTDTVAGYLGAIQSEARAKRNRWLPTNEDGGLPSGCRSGFFDFGVCFRSYQLEFAGITLPPKN